MNWMRNWAIALTLTSLLCAGCGDSFTPSPPGDATVRTSALVLTSPPSVKARGKWKRSWFRWDSAASSFLFAPNTTVDLSAVGIETMLLATQLEVDEVNYLVYGYLDGDDEFRFARIHDSDDDGYPDASTATVFLDTEEEVYLTFFPRLDFTPSTDHEYVPFLDMRCQDIRLARDSDDDGWVDEWVATPFAMSDTHPGLLEVRTLTRENQTGDLVILASEYDLYKRAARTLGMGAPHMVLADTNSDEVADQVASLTQGASDRPTVAPPIPRDGMTALFVWAESGAGGRTVEVWEVDSAGADVALLGSVVVVADKTPYEVTWSTALDEGDLISVRFTTHVARALVLTTGDDSPTLYASHPTRVDANDVSATLTLHGEAFPSTGAGVKLHIVRTGEMLDATTTFVSSTELTVALPAFSAGQVSVAFLQLTVDGDASGNPVPIQICEPD